MSAIDKIARFWQGVNSGRYKSTRAMQSAISRMAIPESMKRGLKRQLIGYIAKHGSGEQFIKVEYLVCAHSRNINAITINGTRITPAKGTGEWRVVGGWHIRRADVLAALHEPHESEVQS